MPPIPLELAHRARRDEYVFDVEAQEWYCDDDIFATVCLHASSDEELWCPMGAWEERMKGMEYRVERFEEEDWAEDLGEEEDDYEIPIGQEELDDGSEGMGFVQGLGNEELEEWGYEESGTSVVESLLSSWPPLLPSTPSIAHLVRPDTPYPHRTTAIPLIFRTSMPPPSSSLLSSITPPSSPSSIYIPILPPFSNPTDFEFNFVKFQVQRCSDHGVTQKCEK